jgi:hypothetical protein
VGAGVRRAVDALRPVAVVAAALAVLATPAAAEMEISIRPADEAPVELLRPAADEVLVSGRSSTVAWRPLVDLAALGLSEWEAFLSFDGGRSWPVRVTPHLDIDRSLFSFAIPLVPSDDVRLMLRFGDERREVGYILPRVLRSVAPVGGCLPMPGPLPVDGRGEAARPGDPGVELWVEGGGDGRACETRAASCRLPEARRPGGDDGVARPALLPSDRQAPDGALRSGRATSFGVGRPSTSPIGRTLRCLPLLLLLCRRNE